MNFISEEKCTGCESCVSVCPEKCITLQIRNGFYYPVVEGKKCIGCKQCKTVCPVLYDPDNSTAEKPSVFAAAAKSDVIRKESSSGGVFSILADKILENGGIVFGASYEKSTFKVKHIGIDDKKKIIDLCGSKYVQSSIGSSYAEAKKALENGKHVLFCGTPCQIAGLNTFLKKKYDRLLCVQIICHGVASPLLWQKYRSYLQDKYSSVLRSFSFRDKKTGWKNYSVSGTTSDGTRFSQPYYINPYMQLFLYNYSLRDCCFHCQFKDDPVFADITLGDFWGINSIQPDFNDNKGVSLIIISTEKGRAFFDSVSDELKRKETFYDKVIPMHAAYNKSAYRPGGYTDFQKEISELSFDKLYKKYIIFNTEYAKANVINVLRATKQKLKKI